MLEKLSSVLKKTTDKIANAIFLDKNLVDQIVKDLQRALIEADVNVSLVLQITQKIKKAALDERIVGLEKKEHIIKLLHDELINLLGKKREISLSQTTNTWMMLGLYGQGKCVHGNSKVQLSDGSMPKIEELYNKYAKKLSMEMLEDESIIDINKENVLVPSFNPHTLKIENKIATHLWKLNKKELYEIHLDNGNDFSIKVTPEHPFFVLRNGEVIQVRADEIKESDFIATPREISIDGKLVRLEDKIKKLQLLVQLTPQEVKEIIRPKGKTIKEINKCLSFRNNYCTLTLDLKEGKIPVELIDDFPSVIVAKEKNSQKFITIPTYLNSDFAEFLGYVMGDGNIRQRYIQISNEDPEVINRVCELSRILFNIEPKVNHDKRTRKMHDIRIVSTTLVKVFSLFGLNPGKKGKELKIPEEIMHSTNETLRSFIKAYFDCDSSPAKMQRCIELISESPTLIRQMNMLLKRFEVVSSISKKLINNIFYHRLIIRARYAEKYAEKIGYIIQRKSERIKDYVDIGIIQGCGNQDMIPIGKALKESRQNLGFSIGEIQTNAVYSYGIYEEKGSISREKLRKLVAYYNLKKKGMYLQLLENINNNLELKSEYNNRFINEIRKSLDKNCLVEKEEEIHLSEAGRYYLQKIKETNPETIIEKLSLLAESEVCWIPIKKIEKTENDQKFVYDLTVEDNHSFIADGFVVHNTTTIAKLASYYAKRGNKVCAIGLDVHRPAASEQLKQLCDKLNIKSFIAPEEKNPKNIWKKYADEMKEYSLIIIDTAGRDALSSDLIKEIKDITKLAKPTETFLIMSADVGQTAKKQAKIFKESVTITGVIITKMDSTAKAGGALTACAEIQAPVVFIGVGEKPSDLETFDPESFLSRLLGLGDLKSLMEKIQNVVDKDKIAEQQKKLNEGKFTLRNLQTQLESMESLGSMDKIMAMIPGLGKASLPPEALALQQQKTKNWKNAINSMTKEEIENPEIIEKQTSRLARIAKGSGTTTSDIRTLIKQYKLLKEMIKSQSSLQGIESGTLDQKTMMKLAKKFARKVKF